MREGHEFELEECRGGDGVSPEGHQTVRHPAVIARTLRRGDARRCTAAWRCSAGTRGQDQRAVLPAPRRRSPSRLRPEPVVGLARPMHPALADSPAGETIDGGADRRLAAAPLARAPSRENPSCRPSAALRSPIDQAECASVALSYEFQGTSGPIVLRVLCFLASSRPCASCEWLTPATQAAQTVRRTATARDRRSRLAGPLWPVRLHPRTSRCTVALTRPYVRDWRRPPG
jgi:hypothetical protein